MSTRDARFRFSVCALLTLLLAIVAITYGAGQMEYNHAAFAIVAMGMILLAFAFICGWFARASAKLDAESSPTPRDPST